MSETWAIYTRVSTRQQVDGFSLQDQREKLVAYAESQGWTWTLFEDAGISGELLRERQGLAALLEDVDSGAVQGVLVVDESRLARDDYISAQIRNHLREAGARLATLERGVLDLNNPT
jgi:site-specific DNA recombinase